MLKKESRFTAEMVIEAKVAMKKNSYMLIPNLYPKEFCKEIKADMDCVKSGLGVEINYGGTETRIWSAQKRFSGVKSFFDDSNQFLSLVLEKESVAGTILAIKNKSLPKEDKKNKIGRWHADSWRPQEKIFLFLSDTTEESGPLEFIPNTHKLFFRLRKALEPGFFFDHFSFFKKGSFRPYSAISDSKIQSLFAGGYKAKPLIVKAGTVLLIDTAKLIHRARPCIDGERYALTAYYSTAKGYHDYDVK
jgi:ectoine hydroxylase-related dioxygenase (phytanoyl-CoA dioxygenase family)